MNSKENGRNDHPGHPYSKMVQRTILSMDLRSHNTLVEEMASEKRLEKFLKAELRRNS